MWKTNLATASYECSEHISELLGLDKTGIISFEDFDKRILEGERHLTAIYFLGVLQIPESVYLLDTKKGAVWVRSKVCFKETDGEGNTIVYGIVEI